MINRQEKAKAASTDLLLTLQVPATRFERSWGERRAQLEPDGWSAGRNRPAWDTCHRA
jgi:hypothetical protein